MSASQFLALTGIVYLASVTHPIWRLLIGTALLVAASASGIAGF